MGSYVSLKSKTKLGCDICDKCCINRGDIKITPVNIIEISRYMQLSLHEFVEIYTEKLEGQPLELVIRARGSHRRCIMNDGITSRCTIHPVRPMQCATFPLVPVDLQKDLFFKQDSCDCPGQVDTKVIDWLDGKKGIYLKYKKIYMEWINFVEGVQKVWYRIPAKYQEDIFNLVYYNYKSEDVDLEKCVSKNIKRAKKIICKLKP
ncbi:MAG: YkgJ family cysteine cluster protein [Clostridia bacterium]|nr:YkgJ family cysteine cluster protein [Clostridia bacterium]